MGPYLAVWPYRLVITLLDIFSGYCMLILSADHMASTVARTLVEQVITYSGVPARILSDLGQEFMGYVWAELIKWLGCSAVHTPCWITSKEIAPNH